MELIRNVNKGKFCIEGEVYFDLFEKYISLTVEDDETIYAEECAAYLNALPETVILKLCEASIRYCNAFLDAIGEPQKNFEHSRQVLEFIYPSMLIVPTPNITNTPVIHIELNCEWEEEHGMEWIIRENEVLYVGAFNEEDPWDDFSDKQEWNYA